MKKPWPWTLKSRGLPVCSDVPWVKLASMPATLTPRPTWVGSTPPWVEVGAEKPEMVWLEQVLELHLIALVAGRVDIGNIVTDGVNPFLVGVHSGDAAE